MIKYLATQGTGWYAVPIETADTADLKEVGETMQVQFKKGVLELCVLVALSEKHCYGYELVSEISKSIEIAEGTIYPLLRKLREEGRVSVYHVESTEGPPRKYYALTESGVSAKDAMMLEWREFVGMVSSFLDRRVAHEPD